MNVAELGALVPNGAIRVAGAKSGPLAGLTFAAKDLYDVAGYTTGAGNPTWLATHEPASAHAWAVQALLDAGATLVAKTMTDELAYGLTGRNIHYGAPINPAAPDRITGGSSSGSASIAAAGAVDFSLGSDTGGSVRVPASYCGLYGIRTTHGRVSLAGAVALAPGFDTAGWFTREAALFERVGRVLLRDNAPAPRPTRLLFAEDAFAIADKPVAAAVRPLAEKAAKAIGQRAETKLFPAEPVAWREAFRLLQAREVWKTDGEWITRHRPKLGPDVQERFEIASKVTEADVAKPRQVQHEATARLNELLANGVVVCFPTAPCIAPKRDATLETLNDVRLRSQELSCIAGLAGLPQISVPAGKVDGAPVGLSFMGARGTDTMLTALAAAIAS